MKLTATEWADLVQTSLWDKEYEHLETVLKDAKQQGVDINTCLNETSSEKTSILIQAVKFDDAKAVKIILENSENHELPDEIGFFPLHIAARQNHISMTKLMLEHGLNVNIFSQFGSRRNTLSQHTPLMLACLFGHGEIVNLLLSHGADPFLKAKGPNNSETSDSFETAVGNSRPETLDILIAHCGLSDQQLNPLLPEWASIAILQDVESKQNQCLLHLIKISRNMPEPDLDIDLLLNQACRYGKYWHAQALLELGANPDKISNDGVSARKLSETGKDSKHAICLRMIRENDMQHEVSHPQSSPSSQSL